MTKKMLIDAAQNEEIRVALIDGKKVEDFDFESSSRKPLRGNIYLARVTRVEPSLQAAFVEYGGNRHGFLAFSEIHPDYYQVPVSDRRILQAAEQEMADLAEELEALQHGSDEPESDEPESDDPESDDRESDDRESDDRDADAYDDDEDGGGDSDGDGTEDQATVSSGDDPESDDQPQIDLADQSDNDDHQDDENHDDDDAIAAHEDDQQDDDITGEVNQTNHTDDDDDLSSQVATDDSDDASDDERDSKPVKKRSRSRERPVSIALSADGDPQISIDDDDASNEDSAGERHAHDDSDLDFEDFDDDVRGKTAEQRKQIHDLNERYKEARRKHARVLRNYKIQEVIKARQILLVQVVKEERGTKGAALTSFMSLAGRYCVLMPNTARGGGISRKIPSAQDRKRLRRIVNDLDVTKGMGLIIRTAGAKRTKIEIKRDYDYLTRLWENIRELTLKSVAPCLIYEEASLIKRAIRDLYDKDITRVLVEGEQGYREAKDFMKMLMPSHAKFVQPYKEQTPLFLHFDVEQQLDAMYQPMVRLKSGGYLVIHQTEALIAVDVNSGKATRERNIEATALKTNMEAATEVARQCKLRDLAGLIVIDFIDMEEMKNNRAVERRLKESLKNDRARIQIGRISNFGLLEMSRQRRRSGIVDGTTHTCPTCSGSGAVRSHEMAALRILRSIEAEALANRAAIISVKTSTDVALYILNHKRDWLMRIESQYALSIEITADPEKAGDLYEVERRGVARAMPERTTAIQADYTIDTDIEDDESVDDEEDNETQTQSRGQTSDRRDDADNDENSGRKRKRRRRRRRDVNDGEAGSADEESREDRAAIAQDATSNDAGEDNQDVAARDTNSTDTDEEAKAKKRRRRGRRGGRRHREQDGQEARNENAAAASAETMNAPEDQKVDQNADHGDEDGVRSQTPVAAVSEEKAEPIEASAPTADDGTPEPVEKPKRKRRVTAKVAKDTASDDEPKSADAEPTNRSTKARPKPVDAPVEPVAAVDDEPTPAAKPKTDGKKGWWQRALGA